MVDPNMKIEEEGCVRCGFQTESDVSKDEVCVSFYFKYQDVC